MAKRLYRHIDFDFDALLYAADLVTSERSGVGPNGHLRHARETRRHVFRWLNRVGPSRQIATRLPSPVRTMGLAQLFRRPEICGPARPMGSAGWRRFRTPRYGSWDPLAALFSFSHPSFSAAGVVASPARPLRPHCRPLHVHADDISDRPAMYLGCWCLAMYVSCVCGMSGRRRVLSLSALPCPSTTLFLLSLAWIGTRARMTLLVCTTVLLGG